MGRKVIGKTSEGEGYQLTTIVFRTYRMLWKGSRGFAVLVNENSETREGM
ncbi:MAG: hypothetical protein GY792_32910 [Gammaproteobacteria bacterium]|nr:hypothetical protein [Gammaproteobacteria bacterium]